MKNAILYGDAKQKIEFRYRNSANKYTSHCHTFKGIITGMVERYEQATSVHIKEKLRSFLSLQSCQICNGERLNASARHVYIAKTRLPEISAMTTTDVLEFFAKLKLSKKQSKICRENFN